MDWIVMRHGETDWNRERRIQGVQDVGLNEAGQEQVRQACRQLLQSGLRFSRIVSSPLVRARQSAQIAQEVLGLPLLVLPHLRERSFGPLEGKTIAELRRDYRIDDVEEIDGAAFGLETMAQVRQRIRRGFAWLAAAYPAERLLIITHGSLIKCIGEMCRQPAGILPNPGYIRVPARLWSSFATAQTAAAVCENAAPSQGPYDLRARRVPNVQNV